MIGYIYKIKCFKTGKFYIGSTNNINKRKRQHIDSLHNETNSKKLIDNNFYVFSIIDKREFPNDLSLKLLENLYIVIGKKNNNCVNKHLAVLTKNLNKFRIKQHNDKIENIERRKIYQIKNRLSINEYSKEWQRKNKTKRNEKAREKIKCNYCNLFYNRSSMKRHILRNHT